MTQELVVGVLDRLASARPEELVAGVVNLVVTVAAIGELAWLWHHQPQGSRARAREAVAAAGMAVGAMLVAIGMTVATAVVWSWWATLAPDQWARWWSGTALAFPVAFLAWDAAGYVYHRLGHTTALGWAAHRPHHTGTEYNLTLAWRQSWFPVLSVAVMPVVAVTGLPRGSVLLVAAVSNLVQALQHTSREWPLPRWAADVVFTPDRHRTHHLRGAGAVNLGPTLTLWDRVGGTWDPARCTGGTFGEAAASGSLDVVRMQLAGWRALLGAGRDHGRGGGRGRQAVRSRCRRRSADGSDTAPHGSPTSTASTGSFP